MKNMYRHENHNLQYYANHYTINMYGNISNFSDHNMIYRMSSIREMNISVQADEHEHDKSMHPPPVCMRYSTLVASAESVSSASRASHTSLGVAVSTAGVYQGIQRWR